MRLTQYGYGGPVMVLQCMRCPRVLFRRATLAAAHAPDGHSLRIVASAAQFG